METDFNKLVAEISAKQAQIESEQEITEQLHKVASDADSDKVWDLYLFHDAKVTKLKDELYWLTDTLEGELKRAGVKNLKQIEK